MHWCCFLAVSVCLGHGQYLPAECSSLLQFPANFLTLSSSFLHVLTIKQLYLSSDIFFLIRPPDDSWGAFSFASVLLCFLIFWQPHSNLLDGRETPREKYMTDWVKSQKWLTFCPSPSLILQRSKSAKSVLIFDISPLWCTLVSKRSNR